MNKCALGTLYFSYPPETATGELDQEIERRLIQFCSVVVKIVAVTTFEDFMAFH